MGKQNNAIPILFIFIFLSCVNTNKGPESDTLLLEGQSKTLLFFGSVHSNDPDDPMFDDIEDKFKSFNPDFVLIEGGYNESVYASKQEAIREGEMAFVSYLTSELNLPDGNIDPSIPYVDSMLLLTYTSEAILTMYVLRQIYQYQREIENKSFDFKLRIVGFANRIIHGGTLNLVDSLDFDQLFSLVKKEGNLTITEENWIETDIYPFIYKPGSNINSIYEIVIQIRDDYAVSKIMNSLHLYNRVFIIMGGDHLKDQKEKLKAEFTRNFI